MKTPTKDTKENKDNRPMRYKVLNIIGIVLCILLLPIVVINLTMAIQGLLHPNIPPNFLGYTPLIVTSGSMSPSFDANDLTIIKTVDDPTEINAGEIISYFVGDALVTHRIVERTSTEEHPVLFITQGDANNTPDRIMVVPDDIFGTYVTHIDNIGGFALFMQTPVGMLCFVILPIILLFAGFYIIDRKKYKDELKKQQEALTAQNAEQTA